MQKSCPNPTISARSIPGMPCPIFSEQRAWPRRFPFWPGIFHHWFTELKIKLKAFHKFVSSIRVPSPLCDLPTCRITCAWALLTILCAWSMLSHRFSTQWRTDKHGALVMQWYEWPKGHWRSHGTCPYLHCSCINATRCVDLLVLCPNRPPQLKIFFLKKTRKYLHA